LQFLKLEPLIAFLVIFVSKFCFKCWNIYIYWSGFI